MEKLWESDAASEEGQGITELRLVSTRKHQIGPLVEAALANELRLMEPGIRQTDKDSWNLNKNIILGLRTSSSVMKTIKWKKIWELCNAAFSLAETK